MNMHEIIILAIEKKYGKKISNFNAVNEFGKVLEKEYRIFLSTSTLRRFFKTIKTTSAPSKNTLDAICNYLGFPSSEKFLESTFSQNSMILQQTLHEIKSQECISPESRLFLTQNIPIDSLLISIESIFQKSISTRNIKFQKELISFIPCLLRQKKAEHVRENIALLVWQVLVLESKENFDYFISNHIKSPDFVDYIILSYIDYDELNRRYGEVLLLLKNIKISEDKALFIKLITGLQSYLNCEGVPDVNFDLPLKNLPDILLGRFLSFQILMNFEKENDVRIEEEIWRELLQYATKSKKQNLFFIEVIHTFLIMKRIDLIEIILNKFYEELFDISDGFTYLNRSIYLLAQSFVFIKNNEIKKAESSLSLISPLVTRERDFHLWFKLFYHIALFHITKSNKALSSYTDISKKLNFSYLNESFCLNYFIS